MTRLEQRLRKLEGMLTDSGGLVPHTQKWLEYWDRQIYLYTDEPASKGDALSVRGVPSGHAKLGQTGFARRKSLNSN